MAIAIAKARAQGLAAVGGYQSAHIGRAGAYGEQAAAEGMVALGFVNGHGASAFVAPFGGTARRLATNPLFVAAPTGDPEAPFVLDMATPVVAEGKVRVARNRGAELAPGLIVDGDGLPSTDPLDLYGGEPPGSRPVGALLPLGVAAGYGGGGDAGAGHGGGLVIRATSSGSPSICLPGRSRERERAAAGRAAATASSSSRSTRSASPASTRSRASWPACSTTCGSPPTPRASTRS